MTPPLPFRAPEGVPIIGQPGVPITCTHQVVMRCNCEGQHVFVIEGVNGVAMCPGCRRGYQIGDIQFTRATARGMVSIKCLGVIPEPGDAAPSPPTN